ncbi:MAG TPA: hypothetical protein VFE25_11935 [Opitutaceae bacterium]|jgi:hypothetical protein|nr:hypothetical protein [Opitutaceae bacterium]
MPSDQKRLQQALAHIERIKDSKFPAIVGDAKEYRIVDRPWRDMVEDAKLTILQDSVDWSGVSNRDQAHILLGEVDPGKISDFHRNRLIAMAVEPRTEEKARDSRDEGMER